jgi:hypothetical protein
VPPITGLAVIGAKAQGDTKINDSSTSIMLRAA